MHTTALWCPLYWRTVSDVSKSHRRATWSEEAAPDQKPLTVTGLGLTGHQISRIRTKSRIPHPTLVSNQLCLLAHLPVLANRPNFDCRISGTGREQSVRRIKRVSIAPRCTGRTVNQD